MKSTIFSNFLGVGGGGAYSKQIVTIARETPFSENTGAAGSPVAPGSQGPN